MTASALLKAQRYALSVWRPQRVVASKPLTPGHFSLPHTHTAVEVAALTVKIVLYALLSTITVSVRLHRTVRAPTTGTSTGSLFVACPGRRLPPRTIPNDDVHVW